MSVWVVGILSEWLVYLSLMSEVVWALPVYLSRLCGHVVTPHTSTMTAEGSYTLSTWWIFFNINIYFCGVVGTDIAGQICYVTCCV